MLLVTLALLSATPGVSSALLAMPASSAALSDSTTIGAADPSKLALAGRIVTRLVPDGSYRAMTKNLILAVTGTMESVDAANPLREVVWLTGLPQKSLAAVSPERIVQALSILDPAFDERERRLSQLKREAVNVTAARMEAAQRDGMRIAYAGRFTIAQLEDIERFFATPTGVAYATELRSIEYDPAVLSRTRVVIFDDVKAFDITGKKAAALTADLPPRRGSADLSPGERSEVAALLGIDAAALK